MITYILIFHIKKFFNIKKISHIKKVFNIKYPQQDALNVENFPDKTHPVWKLTRVHS